MNPLFAIGGIGAAVTGLFGGAQLAQHTNVPDFVKERFEHRAAIYEAVEAGDYASWEAAQPENAPILNLINEDNFGQFQELHELQRAGDTDAADALRESLGLPEKPERRNRGERSIKGHMNEAVQAALDAGDYSAWKEALPEWAAEMFGDVISENNFDTFVQMHELRQAGNEEAADALREDLGLPARPERPSFEQAGQKGRGQGNGQRLHRNSSDS